jgi:Mn-dependent DtxR family transcriptional regulator
MSTQSVPPERDDETGRYTASWSNEDFLEALRELGGVAGTTDVADRVDCSRKTAYHWLNDLADEGKVERREIGGSLTWILDSD